MTSLEHDGENFYRYAMKLFAYAGHVFTSSPEYINHSPEQFAYFDNKPDASLTKAQRAMLGAYNNISRLFTNHNCAFFSVNLLTRKSERSIVAYEIHNMMHPLIDADGTVFIFQYENEVMLSFMGFGYRCILSDWYLQDDIYDVLPEKLDIGNMSIDDGFNYFTDMIYMLARHYYLDGQPSTYSIIPINFFSSAGIEGVDREELDRIIQDALEAPQREYGDDYVEYDEEGFSSSESAKINADLDLMFLELDDEEIDSDDMDISLEEIDDDYSTYSQDEYEYDDLDPEVFKDPTLLVKLLKKQENINDSQQDDNERIISTDLVLDIIRESGFEYVDKRDKGGSLWIIVGENEGRPLIEQCEKLGMSFIFTAFGGKASKHRPAWYSID